ncbi:MAG TPA: NmrA family NAD(P)-binding protein [Patescibacteria group bacterium]|jgi:NAD(P)H dehydrogenase (quinone)|nr:NmrA family NAD(P)-binding protein [Patescibacteria group bacterium]
MILVTGAAGKTGKAIIKALAGSGYEIRALVHHKDHLPPVKLAGAREVIVGDLSDLLALKEAVRGAKSVYHICPNVSPNEVEYGRRIIEASQKAGVDRFVYHSVLHPQIQAMPHHWAKMRVEEIVFESGLPFTILQPAAYMQNLLAYWNDIVSGSLPIPYSADTLLGMVDLQDVAEAAAIVISDPKHEGATYELAGPDRYTQGEIVEILTNMLNLPVQIEQVPLDKWEREALSKGLGRYQVDTLTAMFRYYDRHNFWGNSMVLGWLLGRIPTNFKAFLQGILA